MTTITCGKVGFRRYIEQQREGEIVGIALQDFGCPIAKYLYAQGAEHARVAQQNYYFAFTGLDEHGWSRYLTEHRQSPSWIGTFIRNIDRTAKATGNYAITRERALEALGA